MLLRLGMLKNMALFSIILLLLPLAYATSTISEAWFKPSASQHLTEEYKTVSETSSKNKYNFTIKLIDLLHENNNTVLSFKVLFPNNTESMVTINNTHTFVNQSNGTYLIKPNHNSILTNTSYFYINKTHQLINIGYINYSRLINKIREQNQTIHGLERRMHDLSLRYSKLNETIGKASLDLSSNILNIQQLRILTYTALAIAIISIILTTVNTGRTLYRLKRIEEYIKNIVEDTEIE
jgi:hypothetical protein